MNKNIQNTTRKAQSVHNVVTQARNILVGCLMAAGAIGLIVWAVGFSELDNPWPLVAFGAIGFVIAATVAVYSLVSMRRVRSGNVKDVPFDGTHTAGTKLKETLDPPQYSGEKVLSWLGPVQRNDRAGLTLIGPAGEQLGSPENTLLLTPNELIGITFTQEDFNDVESSNPFEAVAVLTKASQTAEAERNKVMTANFRKWPKLMEALLSTNALQQTIDSHYSFGITRSDIAGAEAKMGLSKRLHVHLRDGRTLKYTMLASRDQLREFAARF